MPLDRSKLSVTAGDYKNVLADAALREILTAHARLTDVLLETPLPHAEAERAFKAAASDLNAQQLEALETLADVDTRTKELLERYHALNLTPTKAKPAPANVQTPEPDEDEEDHGLTP